MSLNSREKANLASLKSSYTQLGSIRQQATFQLSVGVGTFGLQRLGNEFQIGHIPLLRGNYLERGVLLVENHESDGDFVGQVFHALKRGHPVKSFSMDVQNGGGSTIVTVFNSILASKRIVACLADSDQLAPGGPFSSTVHALSKNAQLQTFVGGLFITRCREIENHLPLYLIQRHNLCPQYPDFQKLNDLITNQSFSSARERIWLSFDIKNGINGDQVLAKNYPVSVARWIQEHFGQGQEFGLLSIAGFGNAILQQFLKSGPAMDDFAKFICGDEWMQQFGGFFDEMLWFFASEKRRSTH